MVAVQATTEQFPFLAVEIARREATGEDTYDEWWNGVYRIVTAPSPEHGELVGELYVVLAPLAEAAGLYAAVGVNIGINREDCRVASLAVYRPDTPRTSPAFLETAVLVVEVLLPGEVPGAKLPFYRAWNVEEYLEIDVQRGTVALYAYATGVQRAYATAAGHEDWVRTMQSVVLGLTVTDHEIIPAHGPMAEIARLDIRTFG